MMTNWKTVGVFLDDTPQGTKIGAYAAELAHRCGAHLIGIHGLPDITEGNPAAAFAVGRKAIASVLAHHRAAEERESAAVGRRLAALSLKQDVNAEFRVIPSERADEDTVRNSLHCDLVIVGHPGPHGLPKGWSPERLLMASGVPILIIPDGWKATTIGSKALVAWNGSRQARRAIADAMPFLSMAQCVTVLVVDADKNEHKHGEEPGADIALYLARHGARVDVEQATSQRSPVADVILSRAVDRGMDLIVIGAYSHPRWAEVVSGGVTRTLLTRTPIPVLVSR